MSIKSKGPQMGQSALTASFSRSFGSLFSFAVAQSETANTHETLLNRGSQGVYSIQIHKCLRSFIAKRREFDHVARTQMTGKMFSNHSVDLCFVED